MRIAPLILLAALSISVPSQEYPSQFGTLDGGVIRVEELASGRWTLGFVVVPGCPACEEFIQWFSRAAQAFPEISFLLVAPEATPKLRALVEEQASGIPVLLDKDGMLGAWLEVERAPTVLLSVDGVFIDRLDWPFTEGGLLRKLAESLLVEIEFSDLKELIGHPAPDFSGADLAGEETALSDLPRPVLLVFVSLGCSPCWEILPMLEELSQEVAVALVAVAGEAGPSEADLARLEEFQTEERRVTLLLVQDFEVLEEYKVVRSPTYILIDRKGVVIGIWEGGVEDLQKRVHMVLSQEAG